MVYVLFCLQNERLFFSSRHNDNLTQFFWDNLVTDKKLKAGYLISDGDLLM